MFSICVYKSAWLFLGVGLWKGSWSSAPRVAKGCWIWAMGFFKALRMFHRVTEYRVLMLRQFSAASWFLLNFSLPYSCFAVWHYVPLYLGMSIICQRRIHLRASCMSLDCKVTRLACMAAKLTSVWHIRVKIQDDEDKIKITKNIKTKNI